jgi:hypothetical protein
MDLLAKNVRVADAFTAITLFGAHVRADVRVPTGRPADSHPNDAGYAVTARLFYQAAGYAQL